MTRAELQGEPDENWVSLDGRTIRSLIAGSTQDEIRMKMRNLGFEVTPGAFSSWINEQAQPRSSRALQALAVALGVDPFGLLTAAERDWRLVWKLSLAAREAAWTTSRCRSGMEPKPGFGPAEKRGVPMLAMLRRYFGQLGDWPPPELASLYPRKTWARQEFETRGGEEKDSRRLVIRFDPKKPMPVWHIAFKRLSPSEDATWFPFGLLRIVRGELEFYAFLCGTRPDAMQIVQVAESADRFGLAVGRSSCPVRYRIASLSDFTVSVEARKTAGMPCVQFASTAAMQSDPAPPVTSRAATVGDSQAESEALLSLDTDMLRRLVEADERSLAKLGKSIKKRNPDPARLGTYDGSMITKVLKGAQPSADLFLGLASQLNVDALALLRVFPEKFRAKLPALAMANLPVFLQPLLDYFKDGVNWPPKRIGEAHAKDGEARWEEKPILHDPETHGKDYYASLVLVPCSKAPYQVWHFACRPAGGKWWFNYGAVRLRDRNVELINYIGELQSVDIPPEGSRIDPDADCFEPKDEKYWQNAEGKDWGKAVTVQTYFQSAAVEFCIASLHPFVLGAATPKVRPPGLPMVRFNMPDP